MTRIKEMMQHPMLTKKFKCVLTAVFIALLVLMLITQRHAIACEAVTFSDYYQIVPNLFVSNSFKHTNHASDYLAEARKRVDSTFGKMRASPKIVLVNSPQEAAKFGANTTATAHATPLGTCIVLGPKGQNIDVAAHELVHAELVERVGWFTYLVEIPVWFNEGVALIVDHRKPFLIENIALPPEAVEHVRTLHSGDDFFGDDNTYQHYLASRLAVQHVDPAMLYKNLEKIKNGERFENVF